MNVCGELLDWCNGKHSSVVGKFEKLYIIKNKTKC